jgi:two-component system, chemotaxis family, protein-glutamate methylesterase/glutaminase
VKPVDAVLLCPGDPLRRVLARSFEREGRVRILEAGDPREAIELVSRLLPDVVVLLFDGSASALAAIQDVMSRRPTPILLLRASGVGVEAATRALECGAIDSAPVPAADDQAAFAALAGRIRRVSAVPVIRHLRGRNRAPAGRAAVVAIAASTGGPQAVAKVLRGLGGLGAPVLVVQHLHPTFIGSFLEWMARESALAVEMAVDGAALRPGVVYLAPNGLHLRLGSIRRISLGSEPDSLHRPSADALFNSVAEQAAGAGVGVLLTGMGEDGAAGLLAILRGGGRTIVQDEASSAVYGMAKAAQSLGAAEQVLDLDRIPEAIFAAIGGALV